MGERRRSCNEVPLIEKASQPYSCADLHLFALHQNERWRGLYLPCLRCKLHTTYCVRRGRRTGFVGKLKQGAQPQHATCCVVGRATLRVNHIVCFPKVVARNSFPPSFVRKHKYKPKRQDSLLVSSGCSSGRKPPFVARDERHSEVIVALKLVYVSTTSS